MTMFCTMKNGREVPYYGPISRGFTMSSQDDGQGLRDHLTRETGHSVNIPGQAVTTINAIMKLLSQPTLSVDANDDNLADKLLELQSQIEENIKVQAGMKTHPAAMANQGGGAQQHKQPLSDAAVAERLRARGIDPKHMPRYGN